MRAIISRKTKKVHLKHQLTESNEGKYYQEIKQGKDEQMKRYIGRKQRKENTQ
jgi:hypothetical protein